jgi:hypothetical protein
MQDNPIKTEIYDKRLEMTTTIYADAEALFSAFTLDISG